MFANIVARIFIILMAVDQGSLPVSAVSWLAVAAVSSADPIASLRSPADCERLAGLSRRQALVCARNIELMAAVRQGAVAALEECRHQFRASRWGCGLLDQLETLPRKLSNSGTREDAFLHAISSAGVAHSVTRACSSGQLEGCGCDQTVSWEAGGVAGDPEGDFKWSGCSDNTDFGVAFAQSFTDVREGGLGGERAREGALLNLHNDHAGRAMVETNRQTHCKCHGVSGSCEIKTCFRILPAFRQIGDTLRAGYDTAIRVQSVRWGTRTELVPAQRRSGASASGEQQYPDSDAAWLDGHKKSDGGDLVSPSSRLSGSVLNPGSYKGSDGSDLVSPSGRSSGSALNPPRSRTSGNKVHAKCSDDAAHLGKETVRSSSSSTHRRLPLVTLLELSDSALVYATDSPAYCDPDPRVGSVGTRGRVCAAEAGREGEEGSCGVLCCGRGYLTRVRTVTERCQCRFVYCCHVQCQTCKREVTEYICR